MELILLFISSALINNFVLSRFLGICPFIGVSKDVETSFGMGFAVTFVMTLASFFTYFINKYLLIHFEIEYMYTIVFILIIASLVQMIEIVMKKTSKNLYNALGIYLPLITTNCAVMGVVVINMNKSYNMIYSVVNAIGAGVGFTLAIVLMAGIRERIKYNDMPKMFRGAPIVLIIASFMSIAFLGLSGLIR